MRFRLQRKPALWCALLFVAGALLVCCNKTKEEIPLDLLPGEARFFIAAHYHQQPIHSASKVCQGHAKFEVAMKNGTHIDFTRRGRIARIDAPRDRLLPEDVCDILPRNIPFQVNTHLNGAQINSIEFKRRKYVVGVLGHSEKLIFDKKGEFIRKVME